MVVNGHMIDIRKVEEMADMVLKRLAVNAIHLFDSVQSISGGLAGDGQSHQNVGESEKDDIEIMDMKLKDTFQQKKPHFPKPFIIS